MQYLVLRNEVCGDCGTRPSEWIGPDGKEIWPPPYVVDAITCPGCVNQEGELKEDPKWSRTGVKPFYRGWDPKRDDPALLDAEDPEPADA